MGLERAGFEIVFQVEVNDYCRRVLAKHWPSVPRYGDIREVTGEQLGYCDVLCGAPPCQPVSVAGKQRGMADERWLWPEFARLVREIRPRCVLLENPTGLLTIHGGRVFATILADLAALGFDAEWTVLSACALGAPHTRERVFILAYPERARLEGRTWEGLSRERRTSIFASGFDTWPAEPNVDRMAYGLPLRVDRVRALGNAVVPQVARYIGERILAVLGGGK